MTRIALLHTGAIVIPTFAALTGQHWQGVEVLNLLDDRIVGDLGAGRRDSVAARLADLASAARNADASAVVFTCSSISGFAAETAERTGIPVHRIDEAMADEAASIGGRITVIATLPTTLAPTCALLDERLAALGAEAEVSQVLIDGAFAAAVAGRRDEHDRLVSAAIEAAAATSDVVVLAQASMASAATGPYPVPVLTSPELGIRHLHDVLDLEA